MELPTNALNGSCVCFTVCFTMLSLSLVLHYVVPLTSDGVIIGFERELYRVQAGEEVEMVVAVLAGELEESIELSIRTADGTARGEEL